MGMHALRVYGAPGRDPVAVYGYAWDASAGVYEVFADMEGETYIGCADTAREALSLAERHYAERQGN